MDGPTTKKQVPVRLPPVQRDQPNNAWREPVSWRRPWISLNTHQKARYPICNLQGAFIGYAG